MVDARAPRHVTAGRPLPPRAAPPIGPAPNDLPSMQVAAVAPATPATIAAPPPIAAPATITAPRPVMAAERQPSSRPDPRPMRFAFGAGAVAAMSVMAVGYVRPDFGSTADQPTDTNALAADSAAEVNGNGQAGTQVGVRRVTEYVFLGPGERAPRGATVISPEDDTQRRPDRQPSAGGEPAGRLQNRPGTQAQAPRRQPAPPAAQPQPAPPRVTTRQSGG